VNALWEWGYFVPRNIFTTWMLRNVLTVAFYDPFQPIFDFAESAHAVKYARRIGDFPARNAALFNGPTTQAAVVGAVWKITPK
jgi:hypothetical protein